MGILEDMFGGLSGAEDAMHPTLEPALRGLQGDEEQTGPGLHGLLDRLEASGMGGVVQSWLANGTNIPISPDQIRDALGEDEVRASAARAGLSESDLLSALAEHLPGLVDHLSPNGRMLPAGAGGTSGL